MDSIDYGEVVKLLMPDVQHPDMTLAQAVRAVMMTVNNRNRLAAIIIRSDHPPLRRFDDIKAVFDRADFPKI